MQTVWGTLKNHKLDSNVGVLYIKNFQHWKSNGFYVVEYYGEIYNASWYTIKHLIQ